jgi:hypothetical protein
MARILSIGAMALAGAAALLPALPAHAASGAAAGSDIVVTGVRSRLSSWRQAETEHVVLLSDGSQEELVRLARNLERLHFLLSGLLGRGAEPDDKVKIRITMIGEVAQFDTLDLRNRRWQQGPYNDLFSIGHYYDPRDDGAVMASIRADQRVVVEHTPVNASTVASLLSGMARQNTGTAGTSGGADRMLQQDQIAAAGNIYLNAGMRGANDDSITFGEKAMPMSEESLLYAGYAQHFLLTYFPAAYPRWYLDGFGQIFATMTVRGDNSIEFGRVPDGTRAVMEEFGPYPLKDVLDDSYLTQSPKKTGWTPIHAWMLTHFLFFSDKRRPQLNQYLAARAKGVDAATAAQVFGDQKELAKELSHYFWTRKPYLRIAYDGSKIEQPIVRRLRESEAAFVMGRLELGARVEIPPAPDANTPADKAKAMAKAREDALRQRDKWLARLRQDAARWPHELEAQLLLAEAECRSGHAAECLAAAGRAAGLAPDDPRAMVWKGMAMIQQAAAAPQADRASLIATARAEIVKANRIDQDAVGPLKAYYASFADLGQTPREEAVDGLGKAVSEVPAAPGNRLDLATALAERGESDLAKRVIMPVASGPYDSPEKPAALSLLKRIDGTGGSADTGGAARPAEKAAAPVP